MADLLRNDHHCSDGTLTVSLTEDAGKVSFSLTIKRQKVTLTVAQARSFAADIGAVVEMLDPNTRFDV